MRVVIDLQGLQTESALRGIGRYSFAFAAAFIETAVGHEIFLLLNDSQVEGQEGDAIKDLIRRVGADAVVRFPLPLMAGPALAIDDGSVVISKLIRERYLEALSPDVVIITSVFEFDAICSISPSSERSYLVAAILYDLIPLSDPDNYLGSDLLRQWYRYCLSQLINSDVLLAISDYVKQDAIARLDVDPDKLVSIHAGNSLKERYDGASSEGAGRSPNAATLPYVLYVGAFDRRKNVDALIGCFMTLPEEARRGFRLVLAGHLSEQRRMELELLCDSYSGAQLTVEILGYVDDSQLVDLYRHAHLFVFPSTAEGFGLPPLEAMSFGVPTIAANRSSLPEIVANSDALFDPDNPVEFQARLLRGLVDESYRSRVMEFGVQQSSLFSWSATSQKAFDFIQGRLTGHQSGAKKRYLSLQAFLDENDLFSGGSVSEDALMSETEIVARGILGASKYLHGRRDVDTAPEFSVSEDFRRAVPDYSAVQAPYFFSSMLCRQQHFHAPLYTYWCRVLGEQPRFHRKQWEFVFICQVLFERGYLVDGNSALGFGVGREPLVSFFASCGLDVLATDLGRDEAEALGWVDSGQHSHSLDQLNERGICDPDQFRQRVRFRDVDMNAIPADIGTFDICWSSCAFEHLGSIRLGMDFVRRSAALLKSGGIAVHTTEYNISSNLKTLDNNPNFVIFRRRDIEKLADELRSDGYHVEPIDFSHGQDELERYVDMPPYLDEPHLRLCLASEFTATSLGIVVRAP